MPGAYAHMIAADKAKRIIECNCKNLNRCLNKYPDYLQAGTTGPDFPYLHHILSAKDKSDNWANLMHYKNNGILIRHGIDILKEEYQVNQDSLVFMKQTAWFFGFISHVILDVTIHPVVLKIVGDYEANEKEHRICEMVMDSFIFKEHYGEEITFSEFSNNIKGLGENGKMDDSIVSFWEKILEETYLKEFQENCPSINEWYEQFILKLNIANIRFSFFRHGLTEEGLLYKDSDKISKKQREKYLEKLPLPKGNRFNRETWNYIDLLECGVKNIVEFWKLVNDAITKNQRADLSKIKNWNLDTGKEEKKEGSNETLWF